MELADALSATSAAADALGRVPVDDYEATALRHGLRDLKRTQSRIEAQVARWTHAADAAGAFVGTGSRDTAEWLGKETGTSTRKNRKTAELGEAMARSDDLTEAVASGELSTDQATVAVGAAHGEELDADIIERIADLPLPDVKPTVDTWRNDKDQERDADIAERQRHQRRLTCTERPDGMWLVDGRLDPESGSIVRTTLDGIMSATAFDGTRRTREQRCADALTQLAHAASKGKLEGGRSNTKLIAVSPFETVVERAAARGVTHVGSTLDPATVRKLACDAGIHRLITGPGSSILDFGHENRLVSDNLFLALVARDRQCRWPGCSIRATWCDAHHIVHRADHGPTCDENLVLLCHRHHQLTHQKGWKVTGTGAELRVEHPDGSVELSRPPGPPGPPGTDPPQATTPRAGRTGPEPPPGNASGTPPPWATTPRQLTLA